MRMLRITANQIRYASMKPGVKSDQIRGENGRCECKKHISVIPQSGREVVYEGVYKSTAEILQDNPSLAGLGSLHIPSVVACIYHPPNSDKLTSIRHCLNLVFENKQAEFMINSGFSHMDLRSTCKIFDFNIS